MFYMYCFLGVISYIWCVIFIVKNIDRLLRLQTMIGATLPCSLLVILIDQVVVLSAKNTLEEYMILAIHIIRQIILFTAIVVDLQDN